MKLYRSSMSKEKPDGILTHFGTLDAALDRSVTSYLYSTQQIYSPSNGFSIYDMGGNLLEKQTEEQYLKSFADFVGNLEISSYEIDVTNPLRLNDCWMNDPIGSGGTGLFANNQNLTMTDLKSLKSVFTPFEGIIYPDDIMSNMKESDYKNLKKHWKNNNLFKNEIAKRKSLLKLEDRDFKEEEVQETIWTILSLKLRLWALDNDYDGLIYKNISEDMGNDSVVTLDARKISDNPTKLIFDRDAYLESLSSTFKDSMLVKVKSGSGNKAINDELWGGYKPSHFTI